jgi:hypothetical protein
MKEYQIKGHVSDKGDLSLHLEQFKGKDVFLTVMPVVDMKDYENKVNIDTMELTETQKEELFLQSQSKFMQEYLNDKQEDEIWSKYL